MTRPLRLIHPDVITPVSNNNNNMADGVEVEPRVDMAPPNPVRRTYRFYNFGEEASPESPCIPINLNSTFDSAETLTDTDIDDEDETDAQTSAAFIPSHLERSREREFGRLLRQYADRESQPQPQPQHNNKENIPPAEPQPKYLGLKQIAYMNAQEASAISKKYHNKLNFDTALKLYTIAWLIDPWLETLGDVGVMLENNKQYTDAVKWYMRAVNNGCVVSIYNLADLYDNAHTELGPPDMQVAQALHYYRLGAALNDHGCLVKVMSRYYQNTKAHSLSTNEGVDASVMLNKYYTSMIRLENVLCSCDEETCACAHAFDRYEPKGIDYDDVDREIFDECLSEYTLLGTIKKGDELLSILEEKKDERLAETMADISYLKKGHKYVSYRNKIALFTKLNHVVECPICYETKVNIDLNCAHTFCEDCYVRVYEAACPICRCQCD